MSNNKVTQKYIDKANKLVDLYATHEQTEVDDTRSGETNEAGETVKIKVHVFRFLDFGYALVGEDPDESTARSEVADVLAKDLANGSLTVADSALEESK